ncbi:cystathionine beta-lyase/cystathionine gamma-synthase [Chitinophaga skermanii]|uniref:Cystathionine beta-lyase/cystathionine gamma-synthase n=1 Tax=Chitinophaga skermanii TaxID=331697 RepID=A0A327R0Y5_9BACT|nr:PLP-dependent aspartate aminotransferase family protein [Chitinophaga skermanii]RAJ10546.1 cystathionine beta-lyase/cystathionine gamma-synthase [Chitinophaga skermanii]
MDVSFIMNELGEERELYFNSIAPPIMQSSNFSFKTVGAMRELLMDEYSGYLYSRGKNPTVDILRTKLAALDGAEDALVFSSGAAAIFAAVLSQVKKGDHIISVRDPYSWARKMFEVILPRFGVTTTFIDGTQIENFIEARQANTTLVYLESPNSFTYELQDLRAVAHWAKQHGIVSIIDNSFCTPLNQQPIAMGIDMALQSATKYIGGHSDVMAGVLTGSAEKMKQIFNSEYLNIGSGISPMNAWLLLRGLRTMEIRLQRVSATTHEIWPKLKAHPAIEAIHFPFDPGFPQYELAKAQMKDACGLVTIQLKTQSREQIEQCCNQLKHFLMAVSWGGYESLIFPACASVPENEFDGTNPRHRMIRVYFGLEDAGYLWNDLQQALDQLV